MSEFHSIDKSSGEYKGKAFDSDDIVLDYWQKDVFDNSTRFWEGLKKELSM